MPRSPKIAARMSEAQIAEQIAHCLSLNDDVIFNVQTALPGVHVKVTLAETVRLLKFSGGFWHVVVYHDGPTAEHKVSIVHLNDFTYVPTDEAFTHMDRLERKVIAYANVA